MGNQDVMLRTKTFQFIVFAVDAFILLKSSGGCINLSTRGLQITNVRVREKDK
jgi:hypothetical protein